MGVIRRPKKKAKQAELETARFSMSKAVACLFSIGSDGRGRKSQAQARPLKIRRAVFNGEGKTRFSFKAQPFYRWVV